MSSRRLLKRKAALALNSITIDTIIFEGAALEITDEAVWRGLTKDYLVKKAIEKRSQISIHRSNAVPSDHYTYRVTWSGEDEEYLGLCAEFPSLSWLAESQVDALDGVRQLVADAVRDISTSGEKLPMALADQKYSDKFQVRIPPEQHRALAIEAAEQGVSLNRLISARLAVATR